MFGKSENKKSRTKGAVAVGALATVGAISIMRNGKKLVKNMGKKVKNFFKGDKSECNYE